MTARIEVLGEPGDYFSVCKTIANYLASPPIFVNQPDTTVMHWILGDIGMGNIPGLPVGFIAPLNDSILPYGKGGSTGGPHGTDMDEFTIPMLLIQAEHEVVDAEQVPELPFWMMPGFEGLMALSQDVRKALRVEPTFGGAVATSTMTELRPMMIELANKIYRGGRLTVTARARRTRG